MNADQKEHAFECIGTSFSAEGLQLTRDIMKIDQTLSELNDGKKQLDEELYFISLFGAPSLTKPWGWQIDGHHLAVNYFVLGDQVVMSPAFLGAESVLATSGKYKGNLLFQDEKNTGLALMQSLDADQQTKAMLAKKEGTNLTAGFAQGNLVFDYKGFPVTEMTEKQQSALLKVIEKYVNNMREGHSKIWMEEITSLLHHTYFGWSGERSENFVFYYRIHSPVTLIEFDYQRAVAAAPRNKLPTRNHIHTMIRIPNGGDYGRDILAEHLTEYHN